MKTTLFIIISICLLLGLWQIVHASKLLLDYPDIPEAGKLGEEGASTFPEIIRYIYMFALGAAGFVALFAILIGAIMYVTSAGKPDVATDARKRITSALLGIIILLASVLILGTINPNLVKFGESDLSITPVPNGEDENGEKTGYACYCCCRSIPYTSCDAHKGSVLFCRTDLRAYQAATACEEVCKTLCKGRLVPLGYNSVAVPSSCQ